MFQRFSLWVFIGALLGAAAVGLAAWTSHGLPHMIADADALLAARERAQTANAYLLAHAILLFGIGVWRAQGAGVIAGVAAFFILLGLVGFCGGMYLLYIFNDFSNSHTVYMMPAGGICLIIGWVALAVSAWRG